MVQGAKTLKGVRGNLRFLVNYKFYATLIVFAAGLCLGAALCGSAALADHDPVDRFAAEFDQALDEADREFAETFQIADSDGFQIAHAGGLAKDGCHRDKAAGGRHWHSDGVKVGGKCGKSGEGPVREPRDITARLLKELRDYGDCRAAVAGVVPYLENGWRPGQQARNKNKALARLKRACAIE